MGKQNPPASVHVKVTADKTLDKISPQAYSANQSRNPGFHKRTAMTKERLDVVGYWTEIKLQILQDYAKAYAQVLQNQRSIKHAAYIDGFAGAGVHISRESGELIAGSPARVLSIQPRFSHYHFVEMDAARAKRLHGMGDQKEVTVYQGDCNEVLLQEIFPQCRYEDYRRALCLLDPYDLTGRCKTG